MDKKAIFDSVSNMEEQIGELYQQLGDLKQTLGEMLEENSRLTIENEHLRRHFNINSEETDSEKSPASKQKEEVDQIIELGEGHDNLIQLYKEGFHVCNVHFGRPRGDNEDCLFCLSLLNKK